MRKSVADQNEAIERLHEYLKPGSVVTTVTRHTSRSGMQREISMAVCHEGTIVNLDYWVAHALGYKLGKHDGIVVGGCGMDMGFHLVYNLGRALWRDGTPQPHGKRNGQPDSDGGYALKHRWL